MPLTCVPIFLHLVTLYTYDRRQWWLYLVFVLLTTKLGQSSFVQSTRPYEQWDVKHISYIIYTYILYILWANIYFPKVFYHLSARLRTDHHALIFFQLLIFGLNLFRGSILLIKISFLLAWYRLSNAHNVDDINLFVFMHIDHPLDLTTESLHFRKISTLTLFLLFPTDHLNYEEEQKCRRYTFSEQHEHCHISSGLVSYRVCMSIHSKCFYC